MTSWSLLVGGRWARLGAVLFLLAIGEPAMARPPSAEPPSASAPRGRLRRILSAPWSWSRPKRDDAVRRSQQTVEEAETDASRSQDPPTPGDDGTQDPATSSDTDPDPDAAATDADPPANAGAAAEEGSGSTMSADLDLPAAARALGGGGPTIENLAAQGVQDAATLEKDVVKHLQELLGSDFEATPVKVYGWFQNSYTGNANGTPKNGQNFGVNPNDRANQWQMNQLYMVVENPIEQGDHINFGFRFDGVFGQDWVFDYNQGLFNDAFPLYSNTGFGMPQLYGEVHLPILTKGGIDVKGGKFYAIAGYEQVPAISRPLLSVPYMFNYGQPFTHFGVLTTLRLTDRINLYNGSVNGWDRWINERYIWGYLGGFSWTSKSAKTTFSSTVAWGPNQFPNFLPGNQQLYLDGYVNIPSLAGLPNAGYARNTRTLFTHVGAHKWSDKLSQVMETDQGWELSVPGLASGGRNGAARTGTWFGFGNWFLYEFDPKLTGVWRSEIFWDPQGLRLQNMVNGRFVGDRYHEMTLGLIYKPNPNVWIRPEARYDWSQYHRAYNDDTRKSQLTLAFDIVLLW